MKKLLRTLLLGIAVNAAASFGAATVSGVITDSTTSEKLAGVVISLQLNTTVVKKDTTDADGAYSIADVAAGGYVVRATKTGYVTKNVIDTVTAEATESKVDIAIVKTVTTTISGVVTDSGAATALAKVIVQLRNSTGMTTATDTADADGKYSFANVLAGDYTVRAASTGYTTKTAKVSVTTSTPITTDIALAAIILSSVAGTVTDSAAGTALKSAIVTLRYSTKTVTDTTDTTGKYSFADIPTGVCSLTVALAKYTTKKQAVTLTSATPDTVNVQLALTITTTVSGTITDSTSGTALAKVAVAIRQNNLSIAYDTTGDDGKYSFENVPVGEYIIRTTFTGYTQKLVPASVLTGTAVTVDVKIVAIPVTTVSGTVTDSAAGTPLAGAVVQFTQGTKILNDTTGTDGIYSFEKIPVGKISLRGSCKGYVSKTLNDSIADATAKTVNLPLAAVKYGTIEGVVTADSLAGTAIEGVTVILSKNSGMPVAVDTATTDAQGKYLFEKIESAIGYSIKGSKTGFTGKTATLASKSAGTDTVNLFLATIVTKNVTIIVKKAADSSAIAGAAISLSQSVSASGPSLATTDANGKAVFEKTVQGTYTVSGSAAGCTPASVSYTLNATTPDSVVLYLATAATGTKTITGTVTDSLKATPLAGVVVSVRLNGATAGAPSITIAVKTSESGAYTLTGIPAATASITLSASLINYRAYTKAPLALGTANSADTTKFDFRMLTTSAGIIDHTPAIKGICQPSIRLSRNGVISLVNFNGMINVNVFNLSGKVVYQHAFTAATNTAIEVGGIRFSDAQYIVSVTGNSNSTLNKTVMVCR